LIHYLFSPEDGENAAGLSYIRVPLGASDFSAKRKFPKISFVFGPALLNCRVVVYSFDDTDGDTLFNNFNINRAPSYLFSVIRDIQSINKGVHVLFCPNKRS
jgi:hypothetical protein